mmetsp:Transcript_32280/g.96829  ORF Transcript_32280/g.96829 Transcript_32280/m.96829 type:complete len:203 (+) Transcript_32280:1735-2343(+)
MIWSGNFTKRIVTVSPCKSSKECSKSSSCNPLASGLADEVKRPSLVLVMLEGLHHNLSNIISWHIVIFSQGILIINTKAQLTLTPWLIDQPARMNNGVRQARVNKILFCLTLPFKYVTSARSPVLKHLSSKLVKGIIRVSASLGGTKNYMCVVRQTFGCINLITLPNPVNLLWLAIREAELWPPCILVHFACGGRSAARGTG